MRLGAAPRPAASNVVLLRSVDVQIENDVIGHPRTVGAAQRRRSRQPVRGPPHRSYSAVHEAHAAAPSSGTMRFSFPLHAKILALYGEGHSDTSIGKW